MTGGILAVLAAVIGCGVALALNELYLGWREERSRAAPERRITLPPPPTVVADMMIRSLSAGHNEDGYAEPGLTLSVRWVGQLLAWDLRVEGVSHLHYDLDRLRRGIVEAVVYARSRRQPRRTPEHLEHDVRIGRQAGDP